jgi:hypothetical protein
MFSYNLLKYIDKEYNLLADKISIESCCCPGHMTLENMFEALRALRRKRREENLQDKQG